LFLGHPLFVQHRPCDYRMYTAQVLMVPGQTFLFCFFLYLQTTRSDLSAVSTIYYVFLQLYTSAKLPEWIEKLQEKKFTRYTVHPFFWKLA